MILASRVCNLRYEQPFSSHLTTIEGMWCHDRDDLSISSISITHKPIAEFIEGSTEVRENGLGDLVKNIRR